MVINENNAQINTFVKGMNTDTVYDQVDNQQYVYGENIRITKNIGLGGNESGENYSSAHEGCVAPVPAGKNIPDLNHDFPVYATVMATCSIDKYAVVVTYYSGKESGTLDIYRSVIDEEGNKYKTERWCCFSIPAKDKKSFENVKQLSVVPYQELEGVIKLYIATGIYPIIEIRIDEASRSKYNYTDSEGNQHVYEHNVDDFINNRILPIYPVYIDRIVDGSLKTSQVQYTYRYYNKFGITTQLAPLTNKIQVIDPNRSKETGNAQDTQTSIGFSLIIKHRDEYTRFDRLQIFRLSYITAGEDAKVEMIYDGDVSTDATQFNFNDVGTTPLAELTMEEFGAMSGMVVIPKVIEQNQQYMFASNIKDDTIIPDVERVEGGSVEQKIAHITLSTTTNGVPSQDNTILSYHNDSEIRQYIADRNIENSLVKNSYNNIFTSSLFRSLRRQEGYSYGIVYYDKYGRRSNVYEIQDQKFEVPRQAITNVSSNTLVANVCGVKITIPQPKDNKGNLVNGIIGCQIIRRSSKSIYQKTLIQVALARPVQQNLYTTRITNLDQLADHTENPNVDPKKSPYYPTGFLFSGTTRIGPGWIGRDGAYDNDYYEHLMNMDYGRLGEDGKITSNSVSPYLRETIHNPKEWYARNNDWFTANSKENEQLFQIFSSEIDFRRDDILSLLQSNSLKISLTDYYTVPSSIQGYNNIISQPNPTRHNYSLLYKQIRSDAKVDPGTDLNINRLNISDQERDYKANKNYIFPIYQNQNVFDGSEYQISQIKDVKIPEWFDGFSNLQLDGVAIAEGGIKKYQQFTTSIDKFTFDNWVSFALYNLKISDRDMDVNLKDDSHISVYIAGDYVNGYMRREIDDHAVPPAVGGINIKWGMTKGWIGPGGSCFLMSIDEDGSKFHSSTGVDTAICNIRHDISSGSSEPDEFIQYFGFGNFFRLQINSDGSAYNIVHNDGEQNNTVLVFDGDIYITPQELTTLYKTYDFMSKDTLQSVQITNFVPMESKVNTFFDYGMNLLNTNSSNLLVEPGSIDGVTTQDRPVHQYNQIYSANDESNDVFTLVVEKSEDNQFKQRTYYSEPKTNGEYVDNFVIFKPAAYIDVDPKYGEVTNLLTNNNTLYYWQDTAFGKFSVNERSLINDQNGNTIMLGQAGILSRNDYISTKFGMRPYDYCAIGAENGVYWVDINNKAVVAGNSNECVNFGERLNVQNILNARMSDRIPKVHYDVQNNEMLCNCLQSEHGGSMNNQLVFNLKLNIAVGECNRNYEDIVSIKNHLYGVYIEGQAHGTNPYMAFMKYNYLSEEDITSYLQPLAISFVVNPSASTTKVFDSQQVVPAKRISYSNEYDNDIDNFFYNKQFTSKFETDINSTTNRIEGNTSREGNIIYNIPRYGENDWGNRLRGKWMRVDFNFQEPDEYTTISHVITKFRQSYS